MYGQLDKKLQEQTLFNQQQEAQLDEHSQHKLSRQEKKAAKNINTLAEQNDSILFGDMEMVDGEMQQLPPELHEEAVLRDLDTREQTAGRKERKRLRAQRTEILQDGITAVRQRVEDKIDAQVDTAMQTKGAAYRPGFHGETLAGMKANICLDYGVETTVREQHLARF